MTPDQFESVQRIFLDAVELSETDRPAFVAEAAAGDKEVESQVLAMLQAESLKSSGSQTLISHAARRMVEEIGHRQPDDFDGSPVEHAAADDMAGRCFGPYIIRKTLGSGGMGVVYLARQHKPSRDVALKVARSMTLGPDLLRRFTAEAEILGRLQHPGIAAVYEAGSADTPEGRFSYFAMEFVDGEPLTRHISRTRPDLRATLELLIRICEAVGHAHQRGIVHRDLKPGNILVTRDGAPKVLDFGIARVLEDDQGAALPSSGMTIEGQVFGTVPYMSPEQVSGRTAEIDPRTDVYSLGVVAYEALSGRSPYAGSLESFEALVRAICEHEPTALGRLRRGAQGDLDTIVAKAMSKDIERRYRNAAELADEFRRVLHDEPIMARPSTARYQIVKFVRRNRGLSAAVAAAVFVTVIGAVTAAWLAIQAENARAESDKRGQDAALELAKYQAAYDFVSAMIRAPDPWAGEMGQEVARETRVVDVIDTGAAELASKFAQQPEVEIQLRFLFCDTYGNLGENEKALKQASRALELCETLHGLDHPTTVHAQHVVGSTLLEMARYAEAEPLLKTALEWRERVRGPLHDATLTTLNNYANLLNYAGRPEEALPLFRDSAARRAAVYGPDDPRTLVTENNLANLLDNLGRVEEALALQQSVVERRIRVLTLDHPSTTTSMNNLGLMLQRLMRYEEAEKVLRPVVEMRRKHLGIHHERTHIAIINLALVLTATERRAEAAAAVEEVMDSLNARGTGQSLIGVAARNALAAALSGCGGEDRAESLWREAMDVSGRLLGPRHPRTLSVKSALGRFLAAHSRFDEAETLHGEVLHARLAATSQGAALGEVANAFLNLAECRLSAGDFCRAEQLYIQACVSARTAYGNSGWRYARMLGRYGECLLEAGRCENARRVLLDALRLMERERGEEDSLTVDIASLVVRVENLAAPIPGVDPSVSARIGASQLPDAPQSVRAVQSTD